MRRPNMDDEGVLLKEINVFRIELDYSGKNLDKI